MIWPMSNCYASWFLQLNNRQINFHTVYCLNIYNYLFSCLSQFNVSDYFDKLELTSMRQCETY